MFYENKDPCTFLSLLLTSKHTGDAIGSYIYVLVEFTQTVLSERLVHFEELKEQVMEVKATPGKGTVVDVTLVTGHLKKGDMMIVPGLEGPTVTQILLQYFPAR